MPNFRQMEEDLMIKIVLPLVAMLAVIGCKKKDEDSGAPEYDQEMVERD